MSRSHVEDFFPPALALTPKGTGAGYGVGMDLDSMLIDAQDTARSDLFKRNLVRKQVAVGTL